MSENKVKLDPVRGRPMLNWVGKAPLNHVKSFPAQLIEVFDPTGKAEKIENPTWDKLKGKWKNILFHGDNKEVMSYLIANGLRKKIDFVYIDPPFDSGADYVRKVKLRGAKLNSQVNGEDYTLGEQVQYFDIWANDNYLQFLYERLQLICELMAPDGFIAVHMNSARSHYVKVLMDEVFGIDHFKNEIIVKRIRKSYTADTGITSLNEGCDYILLYSNNVSAKLKPPMRYSPKEERWHAYDAPGIRRGMDYRLFDKVPPAGRHWMNDKKIADKMIESGELRPNPETGWPEYKLESTEYIVRDTLWDDVTAYAFTTDYPTEKKKDMLELLIEMCTTSDGIVMDCFMGSGSTQVVAQKLGRRWIGCDINKGSIQTTSKRLQNIIKLQIEERRKKSQNGSLKDENPFYPSFSIYKVNDYDLQILRTEAIELAVEHVGIQRSKTDRFFDGTLGKNLVKIIDFNHPLSLLDLQQVKDELKKRPNEDRKVTLVCLGKELAVDNWLDEYNKKHPVNKIEIIELRTDTKYGKFLIHQPLKAKVSIARKNGKAMIEIKDFISPTIIERLHSQEGVLKVKIDDFRCMIDVVMIDTNYDGQVFNVAFSDVPEKKDDLVEGKYEIDIPNEKTKVAVKIIDMLGEEMIVVKEI